MQCCVQHAPYRQDQQILLIDADEKEALESDASDSAEEATNEVTAINGDGAAIAEQDEEEAESSDASEEAEDKEMA